MVSLKNPAPAASVPLLAVKNAVGLGADVQSTVFSGAKILLKDQKVLLNTFSKPTTAVGAIIGVGTAIYDMINNPNANYVKDGLQVGLAGLAAFGEFLGVSEVWDAVGTVAGAVSVGMDVYDMVHEQK